MNVMIPFTIVAAIMTYAWPFARSEAALIIVAIIYGCAKKNFAEHGAYIFIHNNSRFASGAYIGLIVNPILAMGSTGTVGHRIGMAMTVLGLGALVGPPISGAIDRSTGGFPAVGYYAGTCLL